MNISVKNEFETVPAFTTIAGSHLGNQSNRETTIEMLNAVETTTGIHGMTTNRLWIDLASNHDDDMESMFYIQQECADLLNESMPIPEFCSVELHDNEWTVIPYIDEEVTRVEDIPDNYSEDYLLLVNDHGNVTCLEWNYNKREYKDIWAMV